MSDSTATPRPLIDYETAADLTGTTVRMIRHLADSGRLPKVRIGRHVRIRPEDLEAYIAANTLSATAGIAQQRVTARRAAR